MAKECKNCAHESDFKAHECGTCMVSYYDGEQLGLPSNFKPKIMTKADRIRSMSDEELAEEFHAIMLGWNEWCDYHCENRGDDGCDKCILKWLKQPAEGE